MTGNINLLRDSNMWREGITLKDDKNTKSKGGGSKKEKGETKNCGAGRWFGSEEVKRVDSFIS